jgi:hypothetical protein
VDLAAVALQEALEWVEVVLVEVRVLQAHPEALQRLALVVEQALQEQRAVQVRLEQAEGLVVAGRAEVALEALRELLGVAALAVCPATVVTERWTLVRNVMGLIYRIQHVLH